MRLLIVNPNTSASMTARIGEAASAAAARRTQIHAVNPESGPASIEGYFDEAFAAPGALQEIVKGEAAGFDAFVIACFDDTGLEAARCVATGPVLGIGEAAFHMASLVAHRFSVVTTLSRSIAPIESNLMKYGLDRRCARVRACEAPVLALEDPASGARELLSAEIERAKAEDGAEALARRHALPVIDGVASAVKLAEALVSLGYATSKLGPYAPPLPKAFSGAFASLSSG
jgi:allantoin racemase